MKFIFLSNSIFIFLFGNPGQVHIFLPVVLVSKISEEDTESKW